eukprot:1158026-Pelagomonas_calceolata.AAC.4
MEHSMTRTHLKSTMDSNIPVQAVGHGTILSRKRQRVLQCLDPLSLQQQSGEAYTLPPHSSLLKGAPLPGS